MNSVEIPWTHEHSFKLEAPPDRVYAAFADPSELRRWFAEGAEVRLEAGGPYRFWGRHTLGTPPEAEAAQAVIQADPGRAFAFAWTIDGVPTEVRIALAAEGDGCRLTLRHMVRGDLGRPRQRELIDDHWRLAFGNLVCHLAGGAGVVLPDYADPKPAVRLSIVIAAPKEAVFRALIEPEAINQWFGSKNAVVEPRVGGRYELNWKYQVDGVDVSGGPTRILEFVENERLVLDWPDWRGNPSVNGQWIGFYLVAEGAGTRVNFVHGGFSHPAEQGDYPFGWVYFLGELTKVVEQPRRA